MANTKFPDVPPGHYTLVAWHKSAGFFRKTITVESGHDHTADFLIPIDIDPAKETQRITIWRKTRRPGENSTQDAHVFVVLFPFAMLLTSSFG